jgi:hypothetical protein
VRFVLVSAVVDATPRIIDVGGRERASRRRGGGRNRNRNRRERAAAEKAAFVDKTDR